MSAALRLLLVVLLALTACTAPGRSGDADSTAGSTGYSGASPGSTEGSTEVSTRGPDAPWPAAAADRPVVELSFDVADDLRSATGRERVRFTPDRRVCELVFRLWPNGPSSAEAGTALTVGAVRVGGRPVSVTTQPGGAPQGRTGTILVAALPACAPAGTAVSADLDFTVQLAPRTDGRIGHATRAEVAWLGTAFPLLAWQQGAGWVTDPAVPVIGESATSETFRLSRLDVTAASRYEVAGAGRATGTDAGPRADTTVHHFTADAVRDVTVTVGRLDLTTFEASGTRVTLARPADGSRADAAAWREQLSDALRRLTAQFGPVPYPQLWVSVLPEVTDGVEYPGAIQFGDVAPDRERWLVVHELAHQWFYGLVGNNQGLHPWLDEALATYAQEVVDPTTLSEPDPQELLGVEGAVGESMAQWDERRRSSDAYVATVYRRGGRAILQARAAAGAEAFDTALRDYLRTNAHRIATPEDLAAALQGLPEALRVLREAGALP